LEDIVHRLNNRALVRIRTEISSHAQGVQAHPYVAEFRVRRPFVKRHHGNSMGNAVGDGAYTWSTHSRRQRSVVRSLMAEHHRARRGSYA
jgi:hypothetical protein